MNASAQRKNARHGHTAGMADAEPPRGHAQSCGNCCRTTSEPNFWSHARCAVDHHVGKGNARTETRTKRLEHRLLRGEPPCQAVDSINAVTDLIKLTLDKTAREEWVTQIVDPTTELRDLHEVNAMSDDVHNT